MAAIRQMSGGTPIASSVPVALVPRATALLGGFVLAVGFALAVIAFADAHAPSLSLVIGGGLGLLGVLALAVARYETAAALGFLLLAAVRVEPAPSDAIFAVVIAVALVTGRFDLQRTPRIIITLVAAFLLLNLVSAANVVDAGRGAEFFGITVYLVVLGLWLSSYVTNSSRTRSLVRAYLVGAIASAVLSSVALFVALPGGDLIVEGDTRARGFFKDPNVFGPFLVPAALILVEEMLTPRLLRLGGVAKSAGIVALAVGIFLSYSRAAWLNLIIGILVLLLVYSARRGAGSQVTALLTIVLVAAAGVIAVVSITGSASFLEERARLQAYDAERFGAQRSVVDLAWRNPFGVGPGQIEVVSPISAHSAYVRSLGEQGVPGFLAFAGLLAATLVLAIRNVGRGQDTFGIGSAALLGAWCGILANSAFVDTIHWRHLWVVAALVWAGAELSQRHAATLTPP